MLNPCWLHARRETASGWVEESATNLCSRSWCLLLFCASNGHKCLHIFQKDLGLTFCPRLWSLFHTLVYNSCSLPICNVVVVVNVWALIIWYGIMNIYTIPIFFVLYMIAGRRLCQRLWNRFDSIVSCLPDPRGTSNQCFPYPRVFYVICFNQFVIGRNKSYIILPNE